MKNGRYSASFSLHVLCGLQDCLSNTISLTVISWQSKILHFNYFYLNTLREKFKALRELELAIAIVESCGWWKGRRLKTFDQSQSIDNNKTNENLLNMISFLTQRRAATNIPLRPEAREEFVVSFAPTTIKLRLKSIRIRCSLMQNVNLI